MGRLWDGKCVELLIQITKKCEQIWNTTHPRYTRDKRIRHRFWKEITKQFNDSLKKQKYTLSDVQYKWNNLRMYFEKEHKKLTDLEKNSSSWRYYDSLSFLTGHHTRKREVSYENRKTYSLRGRQRDDETDVSVGSMSPRDVRERKDCKEIFSANDVKADEETDYVSIGSVSPPYFRDEDDGQDYL